MIRGEVLRKEASLEIYPLVGIRINDVCLT